MNSRTIVPPEFRINIYLDTNILVDYIEGQYPLLKESITYLSQCPYVNLKSSHYVLFEYTEVRKVHLFISKCEKGRNRFYNFLKKLPFTKKISKNISKNKIKQKWKIDGIDYNTVKKEISESIKQELNHLRDDLNLDFNEHVLHEGLVSPTNNLCLSTKISKEDCLVLISCINPQKEIKLNQCILLTRDKQYTKAYRENQTDVDNIFSTYGLTLPVFLRTADLTGQNGTKINLYQTNSTADMNITEIWNDIILNTLKKKHNDTYLGETYTFGRAGIPAKCIYFTMDDCNKELTNSNGLLFISKDLKYKISLQGPFEYWNNTKINALPYSNPNDTKYSFLPTSITDEQLKILRRQGNLVFYENY